MMTLFFGAKSPGLTGLTPPPRGLIFHYPLWMNWGKTSELGCHPEQAVWNVRYAPFSPQFCKNYP
jgi:hypothetical protein